MVHSSCEGDASWVSLRALVSGPRCSLLVFFDSTCPMCTEIAPHWEGLPELELSGVVHRVFWIAVNPRDTCADQKSKPPPLATLNTLPP